MYYIIIIIIIIIIIMASKWKRNAGINISLNE